MSVLKLITTPDPRLHTKSIEISEITPEIKRLILDMTETMKMNNGVGIAASQVGRNIRLCVINVENGPLALINPQITWKSIRKDIEEEGCLSCPEIFGLVKRSKIVYVKALNKDGKEISFRADGYFARVIQHELDHLNGTLIIDKLTRRK